MVVHAMHTLITQNRTPQVGIEAAVCPVRVVRLASPEQSPRGSISPLRVTEKAHSPPAAEPPAAEQPAASAAARSSRAQRSRRSSVRMLQADWDDVHMSGSDREDSPGPGRKRHKTRDGTSDSAAAAALLQIAGQGEQELLPAVTISPGHSVACSSATTAMPAAQAAFVLAAAGTFTPSPAALLPCVPSMQHGLPHAADTAATPDTTTGAAAAWGRPAAAGPGTATRAGAAPTPAHLPYAADAAFSDLRPCDGGRSLRDASCAAEQLALNEVDIAALAGASDICVMLGDDIGAAAEAAAAAASAAVSELLATQLAAAVSSLSREQLKAVFLAILTRNSPPAAPQHSTSQERLSGCSSALANTAEDEGAAFWIAEVDDNCSQPADGRAQLVLLAGPYPSLATAVFRRPGDCRVRAWQPIALSTCCKMSSRARCRKASGARLLSDAIFQVEGLTVLLPESSQVWLMPGSSVQLVVQAGYDMRSIPPGEHSMGMLCCSPSAHTTRSRDHDHD